MMTSMFKKLKRISAYNLLNKAFVEIGESNSKKMMCIITASVVITSHKDKCTLASIINLLTLHAMHV